MNKILSLTLCLWLVSAPAAAVEISGVFIEDNIKTGSGELLLLNGAGLRDKFWVDIYVAALYLPQKSADVAEILSKPGPWEIQLDFVYKEVAQQKLLDSWREGFDKNQDADSLRQLQSRIDQFYGLFDSSALAKDQYRFRYQPEVGTRISKNGQALGVIPGKDFADALLEIWLGNYPADKGLKKGLLGH